MMNPFRSPTAEEEPVDDSVLAVCTRRRHTVVAAVFSWVLAIGWSAGVLRDKGLYSWWALGIPFVIAMAFCWSWAAHQRWPVLSLGASTISFHGPSYMSAGFVTLQREEIEDAEWGLGYESDLVKLSLSESTPGGVFESRVWTKSKPTEREVWWEISHDLRLTQERSQIREALQSWLRGDSTGPRKSHLTVTRIT